MKASRIAIALAVLSVLGAAVVGQRMWRPGAYVIVDNHSEEELTDLRLVTGGTRTSPPIRYRLPDLRAGRSRDFRVPEHTMYARIFFRGKDGIQQSGVDAYMLGGTKFSVRPDLAVSVSGVVVSSTASQPMSSSQLSALRGAVDSRDSEKLLSVLKSIQGAPPEASYPLLARAMDIGDADARSIVLYLLSGREILPAYFAPRIIREFEGGDSRKNLVIPILGALGPAAGAAVPALSAECSEEFGFQAAQSLELIDTPEARAAVDKCWARVGRVESVR